MSPARAAILAWLLAATSATGAGWRDHLPDGWLLVAEAPSLTALDGLTPKLLEPWDRPAPPLRATLGAIGPRGAFAERAWAIAVAPDKNGVLTVVAYAPTDDFDALCEALDADRADDLALAQLLGFDVAIEPIDGWARISLLDSPPAYGDTESPPDSGSAPAEAFRVTLSPTGCRRLAESLEQRRRGQAADRLRRSNWLRWPTNLKTAIARLAPYAPVAAVAAGWGEPLTLIALHDGDELRLELSTPIATPVERSPRRAKPLKQEGAILWLESPGPLPTSQIDLSLALMASRPDQIEASTYPQPQWDDFTGATRRLFEGCGSLRAVLDLPAEGEPAAANESLSFTWADTAGSLGDRLLAAVDRWNTMVDAAKARAPLKLEFAPVDETGGYRLRTDLITGAGLEPSPEIEAIFDRYYGSGRWAVTELKPLGGSSWCATMRPGASPAADEDRFARIGPDTLLRGELRLDRLTAWRQRLNDLMNEGALGRRVRPPMRETPAIGFRVTGGDRLTLTMTAPLRVYQALVDYHRSEPLPSDDD